MHSKRFKRPAERKGKIISTINMKGGVGKTTLTVNLAACLAKDHNKKVLLVDLDPQTNATMSVINTEQWEDWTKKRGTLADLLGMNTKYSLTDQEYPINDTIMKDVLGSKGIASVDLIPSHLKLTFLEMELASLPMKEQVLRRRLAGIRGQYDFLLCDCPPNLGVATQNGLFASDYYLIPVKPDFLSTIGLGLLENRVRSLVRMSTLTIGSLGVVFTIVEERTRIAKRMMELVKKDYRGYIFSTMIPKTVRFAEAPESAEPIILSDPRSKGCEAFQSFTKEFLKQVESHEEQKTD